MTYQTAGLLYEDTAALRAELDRVSAERDHYASLFLAADTEIKDLSLKVAALEAKTAAALARAQAAEPWHIDEGATP